VLRSKDERYSKEAGALWVSSLAEAIKKKGKEAGKSAQEPSALEVEFVQASDELSRVLPDAQEAREARIQSAHDEFTGIVLPVLKFIGKEIGTHASTGCEISQRIMSRYEMIYRSFDPLTLIGLQNALQEYAAKYKSKCEVLQSAGHPSEHECGDLSVGLTVDGTAVCAYSNVFRNSY
jgi:hypothetical protein